MKSIVASVLLLLLLFALGCKDNLDDNRKEKHDEIPKDLIPSKPCSTLYKGIMDMFVEHTNNLERHSYLFTTTVEKNIVVKSETEVYVTFISEGAGYANSLGYYTYDKTNPPGSSSGLDKKVIFAHVSDQKLNQGDMVQLGDGKFPAGTVIGFFMIVKGWQDPYVNFSRQTHYTDHGWNHNQYQQHVLFKEGKCADIVLGFEDRTLDLADCDFDFNDIIITIADNKEQKETVSFDLTKMYVFQGN